MALKKWRGVFYQTRGLPCSFYLPKERPVSATILHAHSDSPSLKLKPSFQVNSPHALNLLVEPYGGLRFSSWFNRDLFLSGKVSIEEENGKIKEQLVELDDLPFILPQLAVHLEGKEPEKEPKPLELRPLVSLEENKEGENLLEQLLKRRFSFKRLLNFELYCAPYDPPRFLGKSGEMIAASRLDNLASCYAATIALQNAKRANELQILICSDHEEVGSHSFSGAASSFLTECLERISLFYKMTREDFFTFKHKSLAISVDAAHGYNPNFPEKYDLNNTPYLGQGVTLKYSASQKYATSTTTSAFITQLCKKNHLNLQNFASTLNVKGGSTLGPIDALSGIPTADLGLPLLSMHSIREIISGKDLLDLIKLLTLALECPPL
jgi:aspartyl aminopeptidase